MHLLFLWISIFFKSAESQTPEEFELLNAGPDIMIDG